MHEFLDLEITDFKLVWMKTVWITFDVVKTFLRYEEGNYEDLANRNYLKLREILLPTFAI